MTLPYPQDDSAEDASAEQDRPDWLKGMDEDIGQLPEQQRSAPRLPVPPATPVSRPPVPPATPAARAPIPLATPAARAPVTPVRPADSESHPRVEGLVGFEAPTVKSIEGSQDLVSGSNADSVSERGAPQHPTAWSAAASSIPSLRVTRRRTVVPEEIVPEEKWDEPTPPRPVASPTADASEFDESSDWTASTTPATFRVPAPPAPARPGSIWSQVRSAAIAPWVLIVAGVSVAIVLGMVMLQPKGHEFVSIRHVKTHAQELDGQSVNLKGTVGQTFPVGGGFAYYLHGQRDTIVVFTRIRTPVERTKVEVAGKVSTGFLDGAPRPAIFESELLSK